MNDALLLDINADTKAYASYLRFIFTLNKRMQGFAHTHVPDSRSMLIDLITHVIRILVFNLSEYIFSCEER